MPRGQQEDLSDLQLEPLMSNASDEPLRRSLRRLLRRLRIPGLALRHGAARRRSMQAQDADSAPSPCVAPPSHATGNNTPTGGQLGSWGLGCSQLHFRFSVTRSRCTGRTPRRGLKWRFRADSSRAWHARTEGVHAAEAGDATAQGPSAPGGGGGKARAGAPRGVRLEALKGPKEGSSLEPSHEPSPLEAAVQCRVEPSTMEDRTGATERRRAETTAVWK